MNLFRRAGQACLLHQGRDVARARQTTGSAGAMSSGRSGTTGGRPSAVAWKALYTIILIERITVIV
jgi:hypothetical protein